MVGNFDHVFQMATNIETSDSSEEKISSSSSDKNGPIREAKQLGANLSQLSKPENASESEKSRGVQRLENVEHCT